MKIFNYIVSLERRKKLRIVLEYIKTLAFINKEKS